MQMSVLSYRVGEGVDNGYYYVVLFFKYIILLHMFWTNLRWLETVPTNFPDRFWWVIITTLNQLMSNLWYKKTAQLLVSMLLLILWHNIGYHSDIYISETAENCFKPP